jgi:hypothetical protein
MDLLLLTGFPSAYRPFRAISSCAAAMNSSTDLAP